jgi:O-succinylbenzoate synthase
MIIKSIELREIHLPLLHPFVTSVGQTFERHILLIRMVDELGIEGWGECTADEDPYYSEEWTESAWAVINAYLAPGMLGRTIERADQVSSLMVHVRGNRMAKGAVETAVWDLEAKRMEIPLWKHLGGVRREIDCGVSIGIQQTVDDLLEKIEHELASGYRRIKIKIKPGWDLNVVKAVRTRFPDIQLSVDANSAYTLADLELFRTLDEFDLMMIEQPLEHYDLIDHALLQKTLKTSICLDESIRSSTDARKAIQLGACRIINIKLGRVGGHTEARRIEQICRETGIPVWCGGMLEAGIGRAHNIALSTLAGFSLPGDVSASRRYWEQDIIEPAVVVTSEGTIEAPRASGIGYNVNLELVDKLTVRSVSFAA